MRILSETEVSNVVISLGAGGGGSVPVEAVTDAGEPIRRMAWTPQQHYRQAPAAGGEPQGRGYWENEPAPEPEQEPAGLDAATWKIGAAAAQTAAESEAAAACAAARGALAARLAAPAALEGAAEAAEGCVWQLSGLGEAPTQGAQRPVFRLSSAAFEALGTQWRLCAETDESNRSLAAFLQRVGDSGPPESVAFALQLQAARDGQVTLLAEHSADECDFQAAGQGWGKLRLHTSLEQVHEAAAKGTVGVRVRWLRLASAAPPVDAAAPTPAPAEAASSPVELPEGTPEVRTERVTQTVRLAKGSVGFGMNIDNRGVVVSVIAGSPASVRHPDHSWPRPPACLTPFEPPHPPAGLMAFASRTTACHR